MQADNEDFDEDVARRMPAHVAAIRAKLAVGDVAMVVEIEESLGSLLFDTAAWHDMIQKTARGQNAFAAVMERAIETAAEVLAIKDAEQVETDLRYERDLDRIDAAIEAVAEAIYRKHSGIREHVGAAA